MKEKPSKLYRGIKLDYTQVGSYDFNQNLEVNYPPIIDSTGRATVIDGNEYGVYMSDNLRMVADVYGNLHNEGIPIDKDIVVNNRRILIPSVGITYEIDTDGLEVREPFITKQLTGHYNNGYEGKEWIANMIPSANCKIINVRIGNDILHDEEDIKFTSTEELKKLIIEKIEMRKYRLELFTDFLRNMPSSKRNFIFYEDVQMLRSIFGKNGLKYINEEYLITEDVDGMSKYIIAKIFKQNEQNVDFKDMRLIKSISNKASSIDSLLELIEIELIENSRLREDFIRKNELENKSVYLNKFEKQESTLKYFIQLIQNKNRENLEQIEKGGKLR